MPITRRAFVASTAAAAGAYALAPDALLRAAHAGAAGTFRVGVVGCGGRGTGAAENMLEASPQTAIVALADVFPDRLESCRQRLATLGDRSKVATDRCHTGFDAYKALLAGDVDLVILATPPHFRPAHFAEAVAKGKHVFLEKPVAVDPVGARAVLAAAADADAKRLCVVAGTQRRHERCYLEAMKRVADGAIGPLVAARATWNMGGLWMNPRKPEWSDMEWQLRNWLYFTWLSGDHIVEQHVHNLDVVSWATGAHPTRAIGMGGRQVRVQPAYGHVFDHFAVEYHYPSGLFCESFARQTDGCASRVDEWLHGTKGICHTMSGAAEITGEKPWKFDGENGNPYVQELVDLIAAINSGKPVNEAKTVAESTLTAIMGRMSAYTGKEITWEQAMSSKLELRPPAYAMGPLATPDVAVPGRTPIE